MGVRVVGGDPQVVGLRMVKGWGGLIGRGWGWVLDKGSGRGVLELGGWGVEGWRWGG